VRNVTRIAQKKNAYRVLVGKSEGKQPPGKPKRRWEGSTMDIKRIWKGGRVLESSGSG
jgi:hypothetical protein